MLSFYQDRLRTDRTKIGGFFGSAGAHADGHCGGARELLGGVDTDGSDSAGDEQPVQREHEVAGNGPCCWAGVRHGQVGLCVALGYWICYDAVSAPSGSSAAH